MKTIKSLKEITTLEVGDVVVFDNSEYKVKLRTSGIGYYLYHRAGPNNAIFLYLHLDIEPFCNNLGISILNKHNLQDGAFPEVKSLEALTAIVSALFKEYEKQNELPKTWEEFCERNPIQQTEYFIDDCSNIEVYYNDNERDANLDKNVCNSKQEAEAHLALIQLRQLRKAYVKDWEPDWISDIEPKYCIDLQANDFSIQCWYHMNNPLSFPTEKLAEQFLTNFKDLLEIAKPLL